MPQKKTAIFQKPGNRCNATISRLFLHKNYPQNGNPYFLSITSPFIRYPLPPLLAFNRISCLLCFPFRRISYPSLVFRMVTATPYNALRPNPLDQKFFISKKMPGRSAPTAFPGRPQYLCPCPRAPWQARMTATATPHAITASRSWHPHAAPAAHAHGIYSAPVALASLVVPARCYASRCSRRRHTVGVLLLPCSLPCFGASAEICGEILCNFFYPPIRGIAVLALLTASPAPCYHAAEATQQLAGWQGAKKSPRNHPQGNAPRGLQVVASTATKAERKEVRAWT